MTLLVRFNLALCGVLALAAFGLCVLTSRLLQNNARHELVRQAQLMLDSAVATRAYTSAEIVPLLNAHVRDEFLPQSIPFYAATQNFLRLREQHPEYFYKEATLNPTNPRDRALDWEADLIQQFRNDPNSHELAGERDTPMGRMIYLARPIRVAAECMECHGLAQAAPKSMVVRYGVNNGFGWTVDEIAGAQVVSVPVAGAEADARRTASGLMVAVGVVFVALIAAVDAILYILVLRPIGRMTAVAEAISTGQQAAAFAPPPAAEFAALGRAFERMRVSLNKAMKLLES